MRPVVLTILDGWGYSPQSVGNAILNAKKPNIDFINANYPSLLLQASGQAVGMTWGEAGNSEVGHLNLGAGRIVTQYLSRINKDIETGEFFKNQALLKAVEHAKQNNSKFHIAGLLTSGSVHAYFNHIGALVELASRNGLKNIKIHLFTDGVDSGLKEGHLLLLKLQDQLKNYPDAKIATIVGRSLPMERNNGWDLTKKAYDLLVNAEGELTDDPGKKLDEFYAQDIHDNKIPPLVIDKSGSITENDSLVFFNIREDSMRQITRSFVEKNFEFFQRKIFSNLTVVAMVPYIESPDLLVAYPAPEIKNCLAEVLSNYGKKQLHVAESDKYAHATYFFNGLKNQPFNNETDTFIKSERHPETEPQMMAREITVKIIEELNQDIYDFIIINYANADLVAHTGKLDHTVTGVETIDECIGKLREAVFQKEGVMIITADHGNAESLIYRSGEEESRHNLNPVPFYVIVKEYERHRTEEELKSSFGQTKGVLGDVAPTILQIMGIPQPEEMTGDSLFETLG